MGKGKRSKQNADGADGGRTEGGDEAHGRPRSRPLNTKPARPNQKERRRRAARRTPPPVASSSAPRGGVHSLAPEAPPPHDQLHPPPSPPGKLQKRKPQKRSWTIPRVPRTPSGAPQLPLVIGATTVHALGRVCCENDFHTERYIFPVGYEVTRRYLSMRDVEAEALYTCVILRGEDLDGGKGPRFRITPSDDVGSPITAGTATGAWSVIVKTANKIRKRKHSNSVSGPDYFGLGHNTIKHLLQELQDADRLPNYVFLKFTETGPLVGHHAGLIVDDAPPPSGSGAAPGPEPADVEMQE